MVTTKREISILDLKRADLFAGLSDEELAKIKRICRQQVCEMGTICFTAGSKAEDVRLLLEGRVAIEIDLIIGEQHVTTTIHTVRPGEVFSWSALVEPYVLTASARCLERAQVIDLNGRDLLDIFEKSPRIGYVVMKNLSRVVSSRLTDSRLEIQREIRQLLLTGW